MKRRREQRGTVYAKSGTWYVRYSDHRVVDSQLERKRLSKQLGAVADMTKKQARTEAKSFLAKINAPTLTPETAVTVVKTRLYQPARSVVRARGQASAKG